MDVVVALPFQTTPEHVMGAASSLAIRSKEAAPLQLQQLWPPRNRLVEVQETEDVVDAQFA